MDELLLSIKNLINNALSGAAYMVGAYGGYAVMDRLMTAIGWAASLNITNIPNI